MERRACQSAASLSFISACSAAEPGLLLTSAESPIFCQSSLFLSEGHQSKTLEPPHLSAPCPSPSCHSLPLKVPPCFLDCAHRGLAHFTHTHTNPLQQNPLLYCGSSDRARPCLELPKMGIGYCWPIIRLSEVDLAMRSWAYYTVTLCISFLICEMGLKSY